MEMKRSMPPRVEVQIGKGNFELFCNAVAQISGLQVLGGSLCESNLIRQSAIPGALFPPLPRSVLCGIPIVESDYYPYGMGALVEYGAGQVPTVQLILDWRTGQLQLFAFEGANTK